MNKIVRAMGLIALATMVVLSLVGCEFFASLSSVSGRVVNASAKFGAADTVDNYSEGTEGLVVTLTEVGATIPTASAVVNANGAFTFEDVANGTYVINGGLKAGWAFIPTEIEVTGLLTSLNKDLLAYEPANDSEILIIVKWENANIDVDSHLVLDNVEYRTSGDPAYGRVNWQNLTYGIPTTISLDRDIKIKTGTSVNGYPLETIRIQSNPFVNVGGDGWMRYYLRSYGYNGSSVSTAGVLTGNPDLTSFTARANAVVYVMQGSSHLGTYPLPQNTAENTLGVLKIKTAYTAATATTEYTVSSFGNSSAAGDPRALGASGAVGVDSIQ
jgi:hypothetical protein